MSTVRYEIEYFPVPGRAEVARLILAAAGAEWSDKSVTWGEWNDKKDGTPFGQMPVLVEYKKDEETFRVAQAHTIERYLARKFGFAGSSEQDMAILDSIGELHTALYMFTRGAPEVERPALKAKFLSTSLPTTYKFHQRFLQKNGDNGHYLGQSLTWPDIYLFYMMEELIEMEGREFLAGVPAWEKVFQVVGEVEGVKAYVGSDKRIKNGPILKGGDPHV
ncbi:hypothetical protein HK097_005481 [Rhizophlyctis rosea]|uniref:Glutathione S-transferase n=1 Tax=Rhizophlyctis rosea TaxID=64517 RepID=A0AAD5WYD8_9FUNG|nr:hypothetical protein HK097_005481 [Rhizophlyctis rosea]